MPNVKNIKVSNTSYAVYDVDAHTKITQLSTSMNQKIEDLQNDLDSETAARKTAINTETTARKNADTALQDSINKLSVFITPEMYGAKGDGTTDDTAAVKKAFNAATANKPIILTGQYYCTATITVKRDTTVIGAATRPRAILIPYFIFKNGVSPAFSVVGTQDESVDYGGTLENVTFKGVTIALKNAATSACVAFQVQWARFFTLDNCGIYGFTTAVNFANCNGITIRDFEYSTNGSANVTVFKKFNNGGNTGLRIQHITVNNFSNSISKADVLSDTTDNGQAGDRWFEDWLCVGKWNTVIYYTHGTGFSRHVFINRIFADNLIDNLVYLVGSGSNEDAQISDIGCVGASGTYRGLFVQKYSHLTVSGIAGASNQSTYDFVSLNETLDILLSNVLLDGPSTYFISVVGGARIAVSNTRNTETGNVNVSEDASYCQWSNVSTVGTNNLLVKTGTHNQATNVYPESTN